MPRQTLNINGFGGINTSQDTYSIGDNQVYNGSNLDLEVSGIIKGVPSNGSVLLVSYGGAIVSLGNVRESGYIGYESSGYKRDLIYWDGTNFKYIEQFDGTNSKNSYMLMDQGNMLLSPGSDVAWKSTECTILTRGNGAILATKNMTSSDPPIYVFRKLESTQWMSSPSIGINMTAGFRACKAACFNNPKASSSNPGLIIGTGSIQWITGSGVAGWEGDKYYSFTVSILYSTGEESNLSFENSRTSTPISDREGVVLRLYWYGYQHDSIKGDIDPRITGFRVYVAEGAGEGEYGEHRLLFEGNVEDLTPDTGYTGTASWEDAATNVRTGDESSLSGIRFFNNPGNTYEELSGIPENVYSDLNYNLACMGGAYNFVTNAEPRLSSAGYETGGVYANYLFRSKEYRYNMFNWLQDYLVLPFKARALAYYNGKVWAMDELHIARINPGGMYIEDVFDVPGAHNREAVLVTDIGLFFANKIGAYMIDDANRIIELSEEIKYNNAGATYYWTSLMANFDTHKIKIGYDAIRKYVCFFGLIGAGGTKVLITWAFHIPSKRWTLIIPTLSTATDDWGVFPTLDGRIYISLDNSGTAGSTRALMGGSSTLACSGTTKCFLIDDVRDDKKFYVIFYEATSSGAGPTVKYAIDGSAASGTTITSNYKITGTRKGKYLNLNYGLSAGETIKELGFIYKLLRGER